MKRISRICGITGLVAFHLALLIQLARPGHLSVKIGMAAGALLMIFYVITSFDDVKRVLTARALRYGSNLAVLIVVVVAIVVAVNYIAASHQARWDVNADKLYTLSDQTVKLLEGLKEPVQVTAFYLPEEPDYTKSQDLFDSYRYISKNFVYEFVDYRRKPELVKSFGVTNSGPRIVLKYDGKEARVKDVTEEGLTNGLVKVTRKGSQKVYFAQGDGEKSIEDKTETGYSDNAEALKNEGFEVAKIMLAVTEIPKDAAAIIVAGPQKPMLPGVVKALEQYLNQGGHLMIMAEPETETGLGGLLGEYGITLGNDMIIDTMSKLFGGGPTMPVVAQYEEHEITKGFSLMSIFPTARSVNVAAKPPEGVKVLTLASTSQTAWADTGFKELRSGQASFDEEKDKKGPIPVAAVATKTITGGEASAEARLVVFGDSDFADNQFRTFSGNGDLFLNSVSWLAKQEENITIRAKSRTASRLFLTQAQSDFIFYTTMMIIPLAFFSAAFIIWRSRKNR